MWLLALALRISDFIVHVCFYRLGKKQELPSFTDMGLRLIKGENRASGPRRENT